MAAEVRARRSRGGVGTIPSGRPIPKDRRRRQQGTPQSEPWHALLAASRLDQAVGNVNRLADAGTPPYKGGERKGGPGLGCGQEPGGRHTLWPPGGDVARRDREDHPAVPTHRLARSADEREHGDHLTDDLLIAGRDRGEFQANVVEPRVDILGAPDRHAIHIDVVLAEHGFGQRHSELQLRILRDRCLGYQKKAPYGNIHPFAKKALGNTIVQLNAVDQTTASQFSAPQGECQRDMSRERAIALRHRPPEATRNYLPCPVPVRPIYSLTSTAAIIVQPSSSVKHLCSQESPFERIVINCNSKFTLSRCMLMRNRAEPTPP
jgi:hypothetical protein